MTKELNIKDYLHLYIGCEVIIPVNGIRNTLVIVVRNHDVEISPHLALNLNAKPLLRPLSDMTGEESKDMDFAGEMLVNDDSYEGHIKAAAAMVEALLLKGFDLFGLIDAGLAIDKTKEVAHG